MVADEDLEGQVERLQQRLHLLEGLVLVQDDAHAFFDLVLECADISEARRSIRTTYGLSEVQAEAALDMQVRRFDEDSRSIVRRDLTEISAELERLTSPDI